MSKAKKRKKLREAIVAAFEASGMSINQLHLKSGVPYASVRAMTKGGRDVTLGTAERICELLDLELVPRARLSKRAKPSRGSR